LNIHCTALTWHHLTFILLFLCRSILVVTISKMLWKYKRLFNSGSVYHTQKSVVKPVLSQSYSDCCSSRLPCRLHCTHWFLLSLSPCLFCPKRLCSLLCYLGVGGRRFNLKCWHTYQIIQHHIVTTDDFIFVHIMSLLNTVLGERFFSDRQLKFSYSWSKAFFL